MSDMRYTKKDARAAFERLAAAAGATIADSSWSIDDPRREGAWILDHNGTYGGYVIAAYVKSSSTPGKPQTFTAETHPLDMRRRPAREFAETCHYAARAIEFSRGV
jgi:hypothetical protein